MCNLSKVEKDLNAIKLALETGIIKIKYCTVLTGRYRYKR
jgi:hypothetical protein